MTQAEIREFHLSRSVFEAGINWHVVEAKWDGIREAFHGLTGPETVRVPVQRLPGPEVERFGMGPAVVLGQGFADGPGPVRDRAVADLATRDREMSNCHREAAGR
jgi:hypothetical protein